MKPQIISCQVIKRNLKQDLGMACSGKQSTETSMDIIITAPCPVLYITIPTYISSCSLCFVYFVCHCHPYTIPAFGQIPLRNESEMTTSWVRITLHFCSVFMQHLLAGCCSFVRWLLFILSWMYILSLLAFIYG